MSYHRYVFYFAGLLCPTVVFFDGFLVFREEKTSWRTVITELLTLANPLEKLVARFRTDNQLIGLHELCLF